jgi:hypothetical protein
MTHARRLGHDKVQILPIQWQRDAKLMTPPQHDADLKQKYSNTTFTLQDGRMLFGNTTAIKQYQAQQPFPAKSIHCFEEKNALFFFFGGQNKDIIIGSLVQLPTGDYMYRYNRLLQLIANQDLNSFLHKHSELSPTSNNQTWQIAPVCPVKTIEF